MSDNNKESNDLVKVFSDLQEIEHRYFTNTQERLEIEIKLMICDDDQERKKLNEEMEKLVEEAKELDYKRIKQRQLWEKVRKEK